MAAPRSLNECSACCEGQYQIDTAGSSVRVAAGDVAVGSAGAAHGVINSGSQALVIVSVVSPSLSGFDLV